MHNFFNLVKGNQIGRAYVTQRHKCKLNETCFLNSRHHVLGNVWSCINKLDS